MPVSPPLPDKEQIERKVSCVTLSGGIVAAGNLMVFVKCGAVITIDLLFAAPTPAHAHAHTHTHAFTLTHIHYH